MTKLFKRIAVAALSALTIGCFCALTACKDSVPEDANYSVKVTLVDGSPVLGAEVTLTKDEYTYTETVDKNGVATFVAPQYDYSVTFNKLPAGFAPTKTSYTTSGGDLSVSLAVSKVSRFRSGTGGAYDRLDGGYGTYEITVNSAEEELILSFDPDSTGTFAVFSTGNVDTVLNGYAASAHTMFPDHNKDADNRSASNLNFYHEFEATSVYYNEEFRETVGVQARSNKYPATFYVTFTKISDYFTPPITYERVEVETQETLSKYPDCASGLELLEASYDSEVVYNQTDGFYHLNSVDGPVLVVKLTTNPSRLFYNEGSASSAPTFQTVNDELPSVFYLTDTKADGTKYYKDYTKLIEQTYPQYVNKDGVYGVTKELYDFLYSYIVLHQNDINVDQSVAKNKRWLAPCYYYGSKLGSENNPIAITARGRFNVLVPFSGTPTYFDLRMSGSFDIYTVGLAGENAKLTYTDGGSEVSVGTGEGFNVTLTTDGNGLILRLGSYNNLMARYEFIVVEQGQTLPPEQGGMIDYSSKDDPFILKATGSVEEDIPVENTNEGSDGKLYYQYTSESEGDFNFVILKGDAIHVTIENKTANVTYDIFTTTPNLEDEQFSGEYQVTKLLTIQVAKDDVLLITVASMAIREGGEVVERTEAIPVKFELVYGEAPETPIPDPEPNPNTITQTGTVNVTLERATNSDGTISFTWSKGVWFSITLPADGTYTISTQDNNVVLELYATPVLGSEVIDSTRREEGLKSISATMTAGTTYYLYVKCDPFNGTGATVDITFAVTKN